MTVGCTKILVGVTRAAQRFKVFVYLVHFLRIEYVEDVDRCTHIDIPEGKVVSRIEIQIENPRQTALTATGAISITIDTIWIGGFITIGQDIEGISICTPNILDKLVIGIQPVTGTEGIFRPAAA